LSGSIKRKAEIAKYMRRRRMIPIHLFNTLIVLVFTYPKLFLAYHVFYPTSL
jgi:hypothetical protein